MKHGWRGRETCRRTGDSGFSEEEEEEGLVSGRVMETMSPMQRLRSLRWRVTRFSPKPPGLKAAAAEGYSARQLA